MTHFTPGSYEHRLTQTTPYENVFVAGDWVRDVPHGAHGLSQERAYVTGLRAANLVVEELGVGRAAEILDVEEDEPHVKASGGERWMIGWWVMKGVAVAGVVARRALLQG